MSINKKDIGAILIFVVLIIAFVMLVGSITSRGSERELEIVRDAVKNAALTCYAVEGMYPDNIEYLRDHYHLSYNADKYVVEYKTFSSNAVPSILVKERGKSDL